MGKRRSQRRHCATCSRSVLLQWQSSQRYGPLAYSKSEATINRRAWHLGQIKSPPRSKSDTGATWAQAKWWISRSLAILTEPQLRQPLR